MRSVALLHITCLLLLCHTTLEAYSPGGGDDGDGGERQRRGGRRGRRGPSLSLWIDQEQVQRLSGYPLDIYIVRDGRVLPYITDPALGSRLPVIPAEVNGFNFTWQGERGGREGGRGSKYRYRFTRLHSLDPSVMGDPVLSVPRGGRVPTRPGVFRITLPCFRNASGTARFIVRLQLQQRVGGASAGAEPTRVRLPGTPITVRLRKKCSIVATPPSPCPPGYLGSSCSEALCYPHCMHGGRCYAPGRCSCPPGYHGGYCQGGICTSKCLNGGKCVQKDVCSCTRGFYGDTCQYSKCAVPCVNGGLCRGANRCRCPAGFGGQHCEVAKYRGSFANSRALRCAQKCRRGTCDVITAECQCAQEYTGRWCRRRRVPGQGRKVWL